MIIEDDVDQINNMTSYAIPRFQRKDPPALRNYVDDQNKNLRLFGKRYYVFTGSFVIYQQVRVKISC